MAEVTLYVGCLLVIAAAVPTMLWLKRAGDENWRRHRWSMVRFRLVVDIAQFVAAVDGFSAATAAMVRTAADNQRAMAKLRADLTTDHVVIAKADLAWLHRVAPPGSTAPAETGGGQ